MTTLGGAVHLHVCVCVCVCWSAKLQDSVDCCCGLEFNLLCTLLWFEWQELYFQLVKMNMNMKICQHFINVRIICYPAKKKVCMASKRAKSDALVEG